LNPLDAAGEATARSSATTEEEVQAALAMLRGRTLADEVTRTLGAERVLGLVSAEPAGPHAARLANDRVENHLTVEQSGRGKLIALSYGATDPMLARDILKTVIDIYLSKQLAAHTSGRAHEFFRSQHEQLGGDLKDVEEEIRILNNRLGVASLDTRRGMVETRIAELETAIRETETALAGMLARSRAMEAMMPDTTAVDWGADYDPKALASLDTGAPAAPLADAHIDLINEQAERAAQSARIGSLRGQLEDARKELTSLNDNESRLAALRREKVVKEENYLKYSQSLEESLIKRALTEERFSNIVVLQAPTLPGEPGPARRPLKLSLACALALVCSLGFAWGCERNDQSLKTPRDVASMTRLPALASVRYTESAYTTRDGRVGMSPAMEQDMELLLEQVLAVMPAQARSPQLIAITGTEAGAGASTVAANLALALARRLGQRVLFVDMNLRHPAATRIFGVQRGPGVAEIQVDADGNATTFEQNLYILKAENTGESAGMDVDRSRVRQLLGNLRHQDYRYVILDTPPVGTGATAARVAEASDAAILVSEAERTLWQSAVNAGTRLEEVGAVLLGVVLNKRRYYLPKWLNRIL
jgi:Mrp family chromosome partitioning ATPase